MSKGKKLDTIEPTKQEPQEHARDKKVVQSLTPTPETPASSLPKQPKRQNESSFQTMSLKRRAIATPELVLDNCPDMPLSLFF